MISKNPLVLKIAEGAPGDELLKYLLSKQLAFTEEEYLESLVFVLPDPRAKDQAQQLLGLIPQPVKEQYVQKREAELRVIEFILHEALEAGYFNTLTLIIHNQGVPAEFILRIAARAQAAVLETLLENQIRLIAYPEIMERMETNPECNPFIRGRIRELREFYLQPKAVEAIPEAEVMPELVAVIAQEHKEEPQLDENKVQQEALTALQRINLMGISERVRLALTGNKTERLVLIKDANKLVQAAVLDSPKMADDEVLIHARNLSLPGDIIGKIANSREWTKNYTIIVALVENPKTPISRAIGFVKLLHDRDLAVLSRDRNASPVIRNLAMNLIKQKEKVK
ncbi:MAG: hypothetical protein MUC72_08565 [Acidobacteria bacterium]|jgi:hypothetical protein|nr:hypothetical protein [Acidobacteriota bacterium]